MQDSNIVEMVKFLTKYRSVDMIEAVIDTSVNQSAPIVNFDMIPFLNLYAKNLLSGHTIEDVLQNVKASQSYLPFEDSGEEMGSADFDISLTFLYPKWPDDVKEGDQRLVNTLSSAYKTAGVSARLICHHVDAWPPLLLI